MAEKHSKNHREWRIMHRTHPQDEPWLRWTTEDNPLDALDEIERLGLESLLYIEIKTVRAEKSATK